MLYFQVLLLWVAVALGALFLRVPGLSVYTTVAFRNVAGNKVAVYFWCCVCINCFYAFSGDDT